MVVFHNQKGVALPFQQIQGVISLTRRLHELVGIQDETLSLQDFRLHRCTAGMGSTSVEGPTSRWQRGGAFVRTSKGDEDEQRLGGNSQFWSFLESMKPWKSSVPLLLDLRDRIVPLVEPLEMQ